MVKGGKVSSKRRVKPRIRSDYKGSDDSDEDYVVSDEEKLVSEDLEEDYCSSLDASDDEEEEEVEVRWARKNSRSRGKKGVDRFIEEGEEEEDEEELEKVRKNGRSRAKKGTDRFIADEEEEDELEELEEEEDEEEMKKVKKNGRSRARKGKDRYIVDEEEDELEELEKEEEEEGEEEEEEEAMKEVRKVARSKSQNGLSGRQKNGVKPSQKRRTKSEEMADQDYEEEEEDDDDDDDDDEYDEEFTPDEDDYSELEEASRVKKRKTNLKVSKRRLKKKGPIRRKSKKPSRKKQKKTRTLRRKVRSDDDDGDFMDSNLPVREKNGKKRPKKRRRYVAQSDSDFVSAGSSDCDYTISEEEREQVREAMQLCGSIEPNLRSSLQSDKIQEIEIVQPPRKPPGRKGKEKIEQVKVEVVKQVCGICLSEEDKRRVRGTLDCCTHYFCFSCIMEWGKVESRCPLCKQRFKTISKPTRAGTDLRDVCVTVPERDQVYQPTEEELRSYLDPYENVICTECHEGGDDGLMLLCDLCDSPAHTYCVGLGQEVPEGNWYCDGCRPVALGSSSSQVQGWFTEQRTTNNILPNRHSPAVSFGEGLEIDLNSLSSPRSYITQGYGTSSSPWYHVGGFQAASPGSGAGAPTLSGRRLMHRHIQQLISANRMNYLASRNERNSPANLSTDTLNAQTAQGRETIVQHARADGTGRSFHTFFEERLQENPSLQVQDNDVFSSTSSHHRRQVVQDPTTTSADRPSNGALWPGLTENTISGHIQTHQFSSRPNIGFDGDLSPNAVTGPSDIHRGKEQLQTLVISYIKDLSREKDLGQSTTAFQEIARSAMQTVLAACELEHLSNDVIPVQPPSPCSHIELMAGKTSLIKGCCSSCFAQFVKDVVKLVMEHKQASWLTLGL
ncbi:PREDICTED: uncharacterized protein LOC101295635 [Fragaria vesca subsp. vesca]|uniref:remodeling and spacing factor 1 n=1 Tax=Fragaria vesca subsp. vesca TaxID=101020 RepID=UPI0002C3325A|nr:PREDICTED: remodeling and spacing factor 1 [Fragaria vesca subsp. vesca]